MITLHKLKKVNQDGPAYATSVLVGDGETAAIVGIPGKRMMLIDVDPQVACRLYSTLNENMQDIAEGDNTSEWLRERPPAVDITSPTLVNFEGAPSAIVCHSSGGETLFSVRC